MQDKPLTTEEKQAKVFQLCHELEEVRERKKATSRSYNEEIKRIEDEIKDLLDPIDRQS